MHIYAPRTQIGQYEVVSRPMEGEIGVVHFCLDHVNDGRPVALKTLKPEYLPDQTACDRFLREGNAWANLSSHLNLLRCYEAFHDGRTAYLVLELLATEYGRDDVSLSTWLVPGKPMALEQSLLFALQAARGLRFAAANIPGFVHCDLKPENLLVGADRLPGMNINRLRVTDLGLAKVLEENSETLPDHKEGAKKRMASTEPNPTHCPFAEKSS